MKSNKAVLKLIRLKVRRCQTKTNLIGNDKIETKPLPQTKPNQTKPNRSRTFKLPRFFLKQKPSEPSFAIKNHFQNQAGKKDFIRSTRDSNPEPSDPKSDALSIEPADRDTTIEVTTKNIYKYTLHLSLWKNYVFYST